jgi:hypothetical protein
MPPAAAVAGDWTAEAGSWFGVVGVYAEAVDMMGFNTFSPAELGPAFRLFGDDENTDDDGVTVEAAVTLALAATGEEKEGCDCAWAGLEPFTLDSTARTGVVIAEVALL